MISSPDGQQSLTERAFLSDVFHELSQPLTALHCVLELSLQRDTTADELRASVEKALDNAERLRQRLVLMRAINSAEEPVLAPCTADLNDILRELQEDLHPVFAAAGQKLRINVLTKAVQVKAERGRLSGALFCCLEYVLRYSPQAVTTMDVNIIEDHHAELRISSSASLPVSTPSAGQRESHSFELELARRTFQAAGGSFTLEQYDAAGCICRGVLLLA